MAVIIDGPVTVTTVSELNEVAANKISEKNFLTDKLADLDSGKVAYSALLVQLQADLSFPSPPPTPAVNQGIVTWNGGSSVFKTDTNLLYDGGKITVDVGGTFGSTTGYRFGDGDTGFLEAADDGLIVFRNSLNVSGWDSIGFFSGSGGANAGYMLYSVPSSTVPAFAFISDTNTGIGLAAADQLSLIAGGVEGMRIVESGGVVTIGVGIVPAGAFHINGGSTGSNSVIIAQHVGASDGTQQVLQYRDQSGTSTWAIFADNVVDAAGTADFAINTRTAGRAFIVKDSGNVGVNITAPAASFHVINSSGEGLMLLGTNDTDTTNKEARYGMQHYDTDEEVFSLIQGNALVSANQIIVGGGSVNANAATSVKIHTAANNTTVSGSTRMEINSAGEIFMLDVKGDDIVSKSPVDLFISNTDGQLGFNSSTIRRKENLVELNKTDWIYGLQAYEYNRKDDKNKTLEEGLIAEHVAELNPFYAFFDKEGLPLGIHHSKLVVPIISELQNHERKIISLQKQILELESQIKQ